MHTYVHTYTHTHTHTHSLSLSLSIALPHATSFLSLSLSHATSFSNPPLLGLSLSHTYMHTQTNRQQQTPYPHAALATPALWAAMVVAEEAWQDLREEEEEAFWLRLRRRCGVTAIRTHEAYL